MIRSSSWLVFLACGVATFSLSLSLSLELQNAFKKCMSEMAPQSSQVDPCPRRQLLFYLGHVGGNGDPNAKVYARLPAASSDWMEVGFVSASSSEGFSSAFDCAQGLSTSVILQHRLICEHAYRLNRDLRVAKRTGGLELGLALLPDAVVAVPSPVGKAEKKHLETMMSAGFAGLQDKLQRGMYPDFWSSGGAVEYDKDAVKADGIEKVLERSRVGEGPSVVIFGKWVSV